jgi:DNA repair exonuclease SbcCD nuclease subunit
MLHILASGDIHIGRQSTHVDPHIAPARLAWDRLVHTAIDNAYDILILTGDVVDRDNRFFEARTPLLHGLQRLDQAGIDVFLVAGNHDFDVLPEILRAQDLPHVHLLGQNNTWQSHTLTRNDIPLRLTGWSFPTQHHSHSPLNNLPDPEPGCVNIGITHGELTDQPSPYAPLSPGRLQRSGYDLWLLGHIHLPTKPHPDTKTYYTGSPQALSPKEQGTHGPLHIEILGRDRINVYRIPLSSTRYETLPIDLADITDTDNLRNRICTAVETATNDILADHDKLAHVVFDLDITLPSHLKESASGLLAEAEEELTVLLRTGQVKATVRHTNLQTIHVIGNLAELARETTLAGELAGAILSLESNTPNPLAIRLLEAVQRKHADGVQRNLFRPAIELRTRQGIKEDPKVRTIDTARRILHTLLNQKNA